MKTVTQTIGVSMASTFLASCLQMQAQMDLFPSQPEVFDDEIVIPETLLEPYEASAGPAPVLPPLEQPERLDSKKILGISLPTQNPIKITSRESTELWLKIKSQNLGVPEKAFRRAHRLLIDNPELVKNKDYLTLISFDQPSVERRFYLINLNSGAVETHLVSHGVNSGDNMATTFSNKNNSKQSSLGLYVTLGDYNGANGRSLRLRGLEESNSNAERRAIVIHAASYVTESFARRHGRLGRSWGCPALDPRETKQILNKIQDGSVLYIFRYSDRKLTANKN